MFALKCTVFITFIAAIGDVLGICLSGHFPCRNSEVCVPQINICDQVPDCPDSSDEMDCDDEQSSNYYDVKYMKRPGADHDDMEIDCDFSYNGTCSCKGTYISCQHKGFRAVPDDIPNTFVNILDLTGNHFEVLSAEVIRNVPERTEILVLQHCEIGKIESGTFLNFTFMLKMHLDNNVLEVLPSGLFAEGNSLETLTLRYNRIATISDGAFKYLDNLMELDLGNNKLPDVSIDLLTSLVKLSTLNLQNNSLRHLNGKVFPALPLVTLSLDDNLIERLAPGTFDTLGSLQYLYLHGNKLRFLANETFAGLRMLSALTLNHNLLKDIETGTFIPMANLTSLDLRGNVFKRLKKEILSPLNELEHIHFDAFEMCADAPHVRVCEPKGDGISSQEHLLDNIVLRASVWIMAGIGCAGNLVVLLGRYLGRPMNNVVHSLYIKNLALSDLLMGVYLFIIAGVDQYYRGEYLRHEWRWRHSTLCSVCGFLNTLSCESSVLILTLVTWDRFVSVTQPLARKQPSPRTAILTLIFLWTVAVTVALAPLANITESYFGREFYSANGVCLPLYLHNPFANGWLYSVITYMCVNSIALVFICFAYLRMIHEIKESGVACRSTQQTQDRDRVAQRFGIIVLTDCLCWVPVIMVKLAALTGLNCMHLNARLKHFSPVRVANTFSCDWMEPSENYRRFVYASLAIYVLPINSALNPVLYTLTTTLFKKQMRKLLRSCFQRRRSDAQNSGYDSAFSLSLNMFPKGDGSRRVLTYRGTQSSLTTSKNSSRRPTAV